MRPDVRFVASSGVSGRSRRCGHPGRRLHALRVEHHQARVRLPARHLPHLPARQVMDGVVGAVVAPGAEVVLHRVGRREVVREQVPLAAGPVLVEQHVDDLPHPVPAPMAAGRGTRGLPRDDHRLDQRPLLIGQVGLVGPALAHNDQPSTPMAADQPGCGPAARLGTTDTYALTFRPLETVSESVINAEARLVHVAVIRARYRLDIDDLGWINQHPDGSNPGGTHLRQDRQVAAGRGATGEASLGEPASRQPGGGLACGPVRVPPVDSRWTDAFGRCITRWHGSTCCTCSDQQRRHCAAR